MKPLKNSKANRYRIQALERTFDILDCFTFQNKELSLSDIVSQTRLHKTTAKRLIANLTARGYLLQDSKSKRYQLSLRFFVLGGIVFSSFSLRKAAARHMTRLQDRTGATVLVGTILDDQLVYIDKREGHGMIRISSDIGWRRPLHYGMLGMVLMAHLSPKEIQRILSLYPLKAHTAAAIVNKSKFADRLAKIREQGYIIEWEEAVEGLVGMAAPIRDYSRSVIAALGITLPVGEFRTAADKNKLVDTVKLVRETCDNVSKEMGYL